MNTGELDALVAQAEQRLIAREADVRRRWHALRGRVRQATEPWRLLTRVPSRWGRPGVLLSVLGVVFAVLAPWWVLRVRRHKHSAGTAPPGKRGARAARPWVRWIALGWPLLPVHWRAQISAAAVGTLVTLGQRLAQRLFSPRAAPPLCPGAGGDGTRAGPHDSAAAARRA